MAFDVALFILAGYWVAVGAWCLLLPDRAIKLNLVLVQKYHDFLVALATPRIARVLGIVLIIAGVTLVLTWAAGAFDAFRVGPR